MKLKTRTDYLKRRHLRLRRRVRGTSARPRMAVSIKTKSMYVQFIDDDASMTLAAVTSARRDATIKNNVAGAQELGRLAAEAAKEKGISRVVFDRGGFAFNGRVKALADSAREAGLEF